MVPVHVIQKFLPFWKAGYQNPLQCPVQRCHLFSAVRTKIKCKPPTVRSVEIKVVHHSEFTVGMLLHKVDSKHSETGLDVDIVSGSRTPDSEYIFSFFEGRLSKL